MNIVITPQTTVSQVTTALDQQTNQAGILEQEAATGLSVNSPSDNPIAYVQVQNLQAQNSQLTSYLSNLGNAQSTLSYSNSTLTQINSILTQAKGLALQGANSFNDQTALSAIGTQVNALLQQAVSFANSQNVGKYIFSGTASNTQPFVLTTAANGSQSVTYQGANQSQQVTVGDQQSVETYPVGSTVFGLNQPGVPSVFQSLIDLANNLNNTKGLSSSAQIQAISQSAGEIDQASNNLLNTIGQQGADLQNLTTLQTRLQTQQLQTQTQTGALSSADLAQVVTNLQSQQTLMQLTLYSASHILNQNLLQFLQ